MLSEKAKQALRIAVANDTEAEEVIAELVKLQSASEVAAIAVPSTATAEEVADKVNEILAALA